MKGWTAERRRRQAMTIHRWKPWERSTGPKTSEGKGRVARNAYRGATRPLLRELARALRQQELGPARSLHSLRNSEKANRSEAAIKQRDDEP